MAVTAAAVGGWMAANAGTIAAVSTVASMATTAYGMYSQKQQADAAFNQQEQANKQAAIATAQSYNDLSATEIDLNEQAADEAIQQQLQAAQAKGRVNLFAAASGTMGGSVDSMLYDIDATKDRNINTILDQRQAGLYNVRQQAENARYSAIRGSQQQAISRPSWIETGIKMGTQALQGFSQYSDRKETYAGTQKLSKKGST